MELSSTMRQPQLDRNSVLTSQQEAVHGVLDPMTTEAFRGFGAAGGIATLARFLDMARAPAAAVVTLWVVVLVALNVFLCVAHEWPRLGRHALRHPDLAYLGWGVSALLVIAWTLPTGQLSSGLWWCAVMLGAGLIALAAMYQWQRAPGRRIDPGHLGWSGWLLAAAITAPHAVPAGWTHGMMDAGVVACSVVLLGASRTALRHGLGSVRSPWYALGASASLALWAFDLGGVVGTPLGWLYVVLGLLWALAILRQREWEIGLRVPGLYPLAAASVLLLARDPGSHWAWAVFGAGVLMALLETVNQIRRAWNIFLVNT